MQQQQPVGSALRSSAVRMNAETGQLQVLVKLGQQSSAAAGVYLARSLGYGDYVWQIDPGTAAVSAELDVCSSSTPVATHPAPCWQQQC